jgi:hypothetical protein
MWGLYLGGLLTGALVGFVMFSNWVFGNVHQHREHKIDK